MRKEPTLAGGPARHGWVLVLTLLTAAAAIYCFRPIVSIPAMVPKDYKEGYYAQFALRAFGAGALYPDRDSLIANGYPPLYFYVVGAGGSILGDHIVAGRWMALLGLCASCLAGC